jgi:hypothetical protein
MLFMRMPALALEGREGRNVDDSSPACLLHHGSDETGHAHHVHENDVEASMPIRVRNGQKVTLRRMTRMVHDGIDAAMPIERLLHEALQIGRLGDGALHGNGLCFTRDFLQVLRASKQRELIPARVQLFGDGRTHAFAGSGDDGDGTHGIFPSAIKRRGHRSKKTSSLSRKGQATAIVISA